MLTPSVRPHLRDLSIVVDRSLLIEALRTSDCDMVKLTVRFDGERLAIEPVHGPVLADGEFFTPAALGMVA